MRRRNVSVCCCLDIAPRLCSFAAQYRLLSQADNFPICISSMEQYRKIFENNRKWVEQKTADDPDFFTKLAREQKPEFLYIGCADSRVPANEIMGLEPGEVFVHRNVANLVVPTDNNINAVIQYAVEYLHVRHIIVCGHYGCGGVQAALNPQDMGQLNAWLQTLRDVYRLHRAELEAIADEGLRYRRLVELNVMEQCINITKIDHVQRCWHKTGYPKVHGWVYDLNNGRLIDLLPNAEEAEAVKDILEIYDLKLLEKHRRLIPERSDGTTQQQ